MFLTVIVVFHTRSTKGENDEGKIEVCRVWKLVLIVGGWFRQAANEIYERTVDLERTFKLIALY